MKHIANLNDLTQTFSSEEKCIQHLARIRWHDSPVCPNCGCSSHINYIEKRRVWWCGDCARQFSVRIGTIFEGSRLSLQQWFIAIWLLTNSQAGVSVRQLAQYAGVTHKTAVYILARLREVMPITDLTGDPYDE